MSAAQVEAKHCTATRKDGQPCTRRVWNGETCVFHDPRSREWRRKGGRGKALAVRAGNHLPPTLQPAADLLAQAINEVHDGRLAPAAGQALSALVNTIIRVFEVGEKMARDGQTNGEILQGVSSSEADERSEIAKAVIEEMRRAKNVKFEPTGTAEHASKLG